MNNTEKTFKKLTFKAPKTKEIADELINPYRGWYQIHTFKIDEDISMIDREYTLNGTDTLAFVLIDISGYKEANLDEKALNNLKMIFSFFSDYGMDMIVRAVYDTVGNCMTTEPSNEEQVVYHLDQILNVLKDYSASVFVYQGLLIGNWGEMHSSKFLSPARLKRLSEGALKTLESSAFLSVRRPAYVRIIFPEGEDIRQSKVGIFDDAILASPTHLGTFGEKPAKEVRREQSWLPDEEIEYVSDLCDRVPYGGEALMSDSDDALSDVRKSIKKMASYFSKLHVTYLNRIHDPAFIEYLKTLKWNGFDVYRGLNGYEYIGRHLGYRFVLKNVKLTEQNDNENSLRWEITVENVGFARAFFKNNCQFIAKDEYGNEIELDMNGWLDLKNIKSMEKHTFTCMTPVISGDVYMRLTKADSDQIIYFANKSNISNGRKSDIYLGTITLHK